MKDLTKRHSLRGSYVRFGPSLESNAINVQLKPSVTANQYDIYLNGKVVGFISAEELVIRKFPVMHFLNTGKNKLYIKNLDGDEICDFEVIDDSKVDDSKVDDSETETTDGFDDASGESDNQDQTDAEKFQERKDNREVVTFEDMISTISSKLVNPGTEGLSEAWEISKQFPNIVGRVFLGKMKASDVHKLYKVLCAVRDYHLDKPALAVLKTDKAIIEAKKVLVIIDFKKKQYVVKLMDADSKSGTVVHNAMLTHFGNFRQVSSIGTESITGLTEKQMLAAMNRESFYGLESFTSFLRCLLRFTTGAWYSSSTRH